MASKNNAVFIALAALLAIFIIFKPRIGQLAQRFLTVPLSEEGGQIFEKENAELRAEIAAFEAVRAQIKTGKSTEGINAVVYSRYPFNFRNELVIGAGSDDGVEKGDAVVFGKFIIGEVKDVYTGQSVARTVFDGKFQASVRVGISGYDALFRGGLEPILTLVPKDAVIKEGDIIYAVSPGFPYGFAMGEIGGAAPSDDRFFQAANVRVSYDVNLVKAVFVVDSRQ